MHRLKRCLCCGGRLQQCEHKRTRTIEDIPEDLQPVVSDTLPRATLGHHVIDLIIWFRYGLGIIIDQIIDIPSYHLQTKVKAGGPIDAWQPLSVILLEWHEQIGEQAKGSTVLLTTLRRVIFIPLSKVAGNTRGGRRHTSPQ